MATYLDLITGAYRLSGVIGTNEIPNSAQTQDGLNALNELLDEWNSDNLNIYNIEILMIPVVSFKSVYTIGPGGDFDVPTRPPFLEGVYFRQLTTPPYNDVPVMQISELDYGNIRAKAITGNISTYSYYDQNYPLASLYFWPIPNGGGNLIIHAGNMLNSGVTLTATENLPPSYHKALRYNLAIVLCGENGFDPLPKVDQIAKSSKKALEKNNGSLVQRMNFDAGSMSSNSGYYQISSDSIRM